MSEAGNTKRNQKIFFGVIIAGVFGAVGIGMLMTEEQKAPEVVKSRIDQITDNINLDSTHVVSPKDRWIDQSEESIQKQRSEVQELQKSIEDLKKKVQDGEKANAEAKEAALKASMGAAATPVGNLGALSLPKTAVAVNAQLPPPTKDTVPVAASIAPPTVVAAPPKPEPVEEKVFEFSMKQEKKVEPEKTVKNIRRFVPAGAFAKSVLLSGVDAPTGGIAQSNPMPILLKIKGRGKLPNFTESQIKECHVLGAAYGDIASERAMIRLETLSCVLLDGEIIEVPVSGYVAGEDGKSGLRGRLVSKQGAMIARSAMAGVVSGFGQSISMQYQQVSQTALGPVSSVDPQRAGEAGVAKGASNALEKISDWYLARANETYPIIEVDAGRIGEIVFTRGVDLTKEIEGNIQESL